MLPRGLCKGWVLVLGPDPVFYVVLRLESRYFFLSTDIYYTQSMMVWKQLPIFRIAKQFFYNVHANFIYIS